jgi:hypothetical protein
MGKKKSQKKNQRKTKNKLLKKIPADKFKTIMETILSAPPLKKRNQ